MKTTHAVEKRARVRQEFPPSDFESVQSKTDFGSFIKQKPQ